MMDAFFEVVAVAFAYQLAVLPGEKVQFIIAGPSRGFTRSWSSPPAVPSRAGPFSRSSSANS
jgi:hypothetical protein